MLRLLSGAAVRAAGARFAVGVARGVPHLGGRKSGALSRLASVATTDSNTAPARPPQFATHAILARVLGPDVPVPISPTLLRPRNGWLVSDGKRLVAVYAGAAGDDPALGRVVVVRQDLVAGRQTVETLDAQRTGALTVMSADAGHIRLRAADGRLLLLEIGKGTSHILLTEAGYRDRPRPTRSSDSTSHPVRR